MHGYLFHARRNSFISLFYWYNEGNESIFLHETSARAGKRAISFETQLLWNHQGSYTLIIRDLVMVMCCPKMYIFTSPFIEDLRMAFSCIFFIVGLLLSFWHIPHFHSLPIFNNEVENFQGDFGSLLSIACCSIIMEGDTPFWTWDLVCF